MLHSAFGTPVVRNWKEDASLRFPILVAIHRVGLARASLPVAEDRRVEAIDHVLDHRLDVGSVEYCFLRTVLVEYFVEDEALALRAEARLRRREYTKMITRWSEQWQLTRRTYLIAFLSDSNLRFPCDCALIWPRSISCSFWRYGRMRMTTRILLLA